MKILSNLIIPRVNLNSSESINNALGLAKDYDIDSFILFSSDEVKFEKVSPFSIENLKLFQKELNKILKNFFLYIDAEKGLGHRCKDGFLYKDDLISNSPDYIKKIFNKINSELKKYNIFCNLAPVVDLNINNQDILKGRVLGDDIDSIISNCSLFLDSCLKNKIVPCLKHFPGHGALNGDTHVQLSKSQDDIDLLMSLHIKQFKIFFERSPLIMVNHGWYTNFDSLELPASLSKNIITKLLKIKLNYKGLVVADSIRMNALSENYEEKLIVQSFFEAGGDLLLDPYNPIECLLVLSSIYENDKTTFDDKIKKILKFKDIYRYE
tara:strand:- start:105087 stop:106058 length:972 start_codon:yes stop_codon:yes gene_type:complete